MNSNTYAYLNLFFTDKFCTDVRSVLFTGVHWSHSADHFNIALSRIRHGGFSLIPLQNKMFKY